MTKNLDDGGVVVLRATMSLIVFWCVAALGAYFVVDAVVRGRWDVGLRVLGVLMLVVWAAWAFLYRMSIVVDRRAVVVRNLLRYARIPWELIDDIDRRYQVRFLLTDGTIIESWGSPFPARARARRSGASTRPGPGVNTGLRGVTSDAPDGERPASLPDPALETLRVLRSSARPGSGGRLQRGWDGPALVIGAVCAVCALIAIVV